MAGLKPVAGAKFYIGNRVEYKTIVTAADFSGTVWKEVDGWTQVGDLGAEQEALTQTLINQNMTIYGKGVISLPIMANTFVPMPQDPGQMAFEIAQASCKPYEFKIEWGAECAHESEVTISSATPGVVTWTAHGLPNGTPISFLTTGVLPEPLLPGVTYYVVAATTDAFSLAAAPGGDEIDTTTAGSGTHTARAQDVDDTDLLYGFAMFGSKTGGDVSANRGVNFPVQPITRSIRV